MTESTPQCADFWGGTRCQLVAGHDSAHSALADRAMLLTWANHEAASSRRVCVDWVVGPGYRSAPTV